MPDLTASAIQADLDTALERAGEATGDAIEEIAKVAESHGVTTPEDFGGPAILAALARVANTQGEILAAIQAGNNLVTENLSAFARSIANTDVSAQRAAASSARVEEAIAPEEETAPDSGERPADIKELPQKEIAESRSRSWFFGKAALRHGSKG